MRIKYFKQIGKHHHPLRRVDVLKILEVVLEQYVNMFKEIQFTCNRGSGSFYTTYYDKDGRILKIEICLHDDRFPFAKASKYQIGILKSVGGDYDHERSEAVLPGLSGKKYVAFIILYAFSRYIHSDLTEGQYRGVISDKKEKWCDKHALDLLEKIQFDED